MRKKWLTAAGWPSLFCALLILAASTATAGSLQGGIGYSNMNFAKIIVTYSWSGHFPGGHDVCLLPQEVTIPAGGSTHLDPPPGFIATDFVVIKTVLRGRSTGGFTIDDPPSTTPSATIQIPCAAEGSQVWGYQYFGAKDYGPVFANTPMAMDGFDGEFPRLTVARTEAGGSPVLNTSQGHCYLPSDRAVLEDPATRKVFAEFEPRTTGRICAEMTFTSSAPVQVDQGAKR
jgi:hypothetical protein